MRRLRILVAAGSVILLVGLGILAAPNDGEAAELKTVRVGLSWLPNVEYGGIWLGLENGYFAEENLEIRHFSGGPNAPRPLVTMAAGKIDIGYANWLPFLDAVSRGNDYVLIAATFPVYPLGILSLASKPILKAADIVDKKILVQGAKERTAIDATLMINKLPVKWRHGPTGFSPEPLLNKEGDGLTAFVTNQVVALELRGLKRGKDFHFVSFYEMGNKAFGGGMFTTRQYLQKNRKTVVKFLRALTRGWIDNSKNPKIAANLAVRKYGADVGLNIKQQIRQNEIQIQIMKDPDNPKQKLLVLDPTTVAGPLYASAKAAGRKNLPDVSKIVDPTLMQEVYESLK